MQKWLAVIILLSVTSLKAQTLNVLIDTQYYGWLDQYSLDSSKTEIGNESCVPTSSTNALTFLQNYYPIFGTVFTGNSYASWMATAETLITDMGTSGSGTSDPRFVYGLYNYVNTTLATAGIENSIQWSGAFPKDDGWSTEYPRPSYITQNKPTAEFIYQALTLNSAVMLGIDYTDSEGNYTGGGHELLANGITWDVTTSTGTIFFIDPLDPSQSYGADGVVNGPALQTTGTITIDEYGKLLLYYNQFEFSGIKEDQVPANFSWTYASIDEVLAFTAIPEPHSMGLILLAGTFGAFAVIRRRQAK